MLSFGFIRKLLRKKKYQKCFQQFNKFSLLHQPNLFLKQFENQKDQNQNSQDHLRLNRAKSIEKGIKQNPESEKNIQNNPANAKQQATNNINNHDNANNNALFTNSGNHGKPQRNPERQKSKPQSKSNREINIEDVLINRKTLKSHSKVIKGVDGQNYTEDHWKIQQQQKEKNKIDEENLGTIFKHLRQQTGDKSVSEDPKVFKSHTMVNIIDSVSPVQFARKMLIEDLKQISASQKDQPQMNEVQLNRQINSDTNIPRDITPITKQDLNKLQIGIAFQKYEIIQVSRQNLDGGKEDSQEQVEEKYQIDDLASFENCNVASEKTKSQKPNFFSLIQIFFLMFPHFHSDPLLSAFNRNPQMEPLFTLFF